MKTTAVHPRSVSASARVSRRPIRVCIVFEHALFAHGIKDLLQQQKSLRMVGLLQRPLTSPQQVRRLRPDVVLVEGNGGLAILQSVEGAMGVVISLNGDDAMILTGVPLQVSGPEKLAGAILRVSRSRHRTRTRSTAR